MSKNFSIESVQNRIHFIRGHRVLSQPDLALFYRVPANRLLAHVQRLPAEFCFQVERLEMLSLTMELEDDRHRPYVFTEHGAVAIAYLLNTTDAIVMSLLVIRAFSRFRQNPMVHQPAFRTVY